MRLTVILKISFIFIFVILFLQQPVSAYSADRDGYIIKVKEKFGLRGSFSSTTGLRELGKNTGLFAAESADAANILTDACMVEYIEPDYEVTLFEKPQDTEYEMPENYRIMQLYSAWGIGCFGNGVKVGVIDSGAYPHPDLIGNLSHGYNYRDKNLNTYDDNGHGTFVSGLIAASRNQFGGAGVSPKAVIIPLKCFGAGMTTSLSCIVEAIYGAVDEFGCQIINMSFGLENNPNSLAEAVAYAANSGAIIVAAVGNDGTDRLYYPAAYENVIGVGSVNNDKSVSNFSQKNNSVFVTAPGFYTYGLDINGGYKSGYGTSFSTPVVSATIAIAKSANPNLDAACVRRLLATSSEDLGEYGYDIYYGYGLINITEMLRLLLNDNEWFVSPISYDNGLFTAIILNNGDSDGYAISIFSGFIGEAPVYTIIPDGNPHNDFLPCFIQADADITVINLQAGQRMLVNFESECPEVKHLLWRNTVEMQPLYSTRRNF